MIYRYSIPQIPKSRNHYAGRQNTWEYRQDKAEWIRIVALLCRPRPPEPIPRAMVLLHYYFPTRARHDPDNYAGKMILDGLKEAGVLSDDSFDNVDLRLRAGYDRKNPRTEITVMEVPMGQWVFTVTVDDQGDRPDSEAIKGALDCVALALEGLGVVRSADLNEVEQMSLF